MPSRAATEIRAADRYFSSHQVSEILQVTPSSVVKWIERGILEAHRTPGGHRRVSATQLVRFADRQGLPIPTSLRAFGAGSVLAASGDRRFLRDLEREAAPHEGDLRLETISDSIDALIRIGAAPPKVLIFDLDLPGVDGLEVLQRLRANSETRDMAVIALAAPVSAETAERLGKLGVTWLEKPVKVPALLVLLRELRASRKLR